MQAGVEGIVLLSLRLHPDGSVAEAFASQSSLLNVKGRPEILDRGRMMLEPQCLHGGGRWKFTVLAEDAATLAPGDLTVRVPVGTGWAMTEGGSLAGQCDMSSAARIDRRLGSSGGCRPRPRLGPQCARHHLRDAPLRAQRPQRDRQGALNPPDPGWMPRAATGFAFHCRCPHIDQRSEGHAWESGCLLRRIAGVGLPARLRWRPRQRAFPGRQAHRHRPCRGGLQRRGCRPAHARTYVFLSDVPLDAAAIAAAFDPSRAAERQLGDRAAGYVRFASIPTAASAACIFAQQPQRVLQYLGIRRVDAGTGATRPRRWSLGAGRAGRLLRRDLRFRPPLRCGAGGPAGASAAGGWRRSWQGLPRVDRGGGQGRRAGVADHGRWRLQRLAPQVRRPGRREGRTQGPARRHAGAGRDPARPPRWRRRGAVGARPGSRRDPCAGDACGCSASTAPGAMEADLDNVEE